MDIVHREQLLLFTRYVGPDTHEVETDILAVNDISESSSSLNAESIISVVAKQMSDCELDIKKMRGFSTGGVSVLLRKDNGVAAKLKREVKMLLHMPSINRGCK